MLYKYINNFKSNTISPNATAPIVGVSLIKHTLLIKQSSLIKHTSDATPSSDTKCVWIS